MSLDSYLRRFGFAIHARPAGDDPLWRDRTTGKVMGQGPVLEAARARERYERAKAKAGA